MKHNFKSVGMLLILGTLGSGIANAASVHATDDAGIVQQSNVCKGVVKDVNGETVIGASVAVKGTTVGTITDIDGNFVLKNVEKGSVIEISFVGYKTVEIKWNGQPLNVTMKDDAEVLDEVVVVGYGSQKKVNVTGSVTMVDAKVLESRPVQNVTQALQGQIPGLNMSVGNSGGTLDSSMSFNIRGAGTLGSGSSGSPLVLIDGLEGDMNTVNPNDIASVSVLKDAASSSIYGARAAFGVILITTKSGASGKTKVNYTGNVRFSDAIQLPEMVNSLDFAHYFNAASSNAGLNPIFSQEALGRIETYMAGGYTDPSKPEYYGLQPTSNGDRWATYGGAFGNTNWFEEFYKSWVPSQEHNVSVSGGNEKLTYLLSGSFLDQAGLSRHGKDSFNRYTLNAKISAKLAEWATLSYNAKWTREDYERPTYMTSLFYHNIARRWPTNPVYDPYGNYMPTMELQEMEDGGRQNHQKNWITNHVKLVLEPIKDWHITAEGSLRQYNNTSHWAVLPIYGHDTKNELYPLSWGGRAAGYSEVSDAFNKEDYFSTNVYTDYSKTINDHYFKIMAGFNGELYKTSGLSGFGTDLITPIVPELSTTQDNKNASNSRNELAIAGFFARLNYNWKERYMLEANLRYDGSSRFVGDKTWGVFPSFSAGWNIAREAFFKPLEKTIGTLKLRASWGQLGNNNTKAWYPFFQSMPTGTKNSGWLIGGQKMNTAGLPGIVSNVLTWEKVESWDIGIDFGMFNNRFTGTFDYYTRYTYDMVGPAPTLPAVLGTGAPKINNADMKSYGWELELSWRDRIQDFNYGVRFVLSDNQDKVMKYPNESGDLSTYREGMKTGEIWGFETAGIAQSDEEMNKHLETAKPNWGSAWGAGDVMFVDQNGDGEVTSGANTLNDHGDKVLLGNRTPRYNFGLTLDGNWKGLDFSVFFQGVMKRDYWLGGPYFWGASGDEWQSACFKEHLDYWSPENPDAYYPKPYFGGITKNQQVQSRYLQNAAYIRLKNIQIGYTLPKAWVSKASMESVRIYVSGDNLLTFSGISGVFDPETLGGDWGEGKLYPLQRTISVGVNVNF